MKKYELVKDDKINICGIELFRIKSLIKFSAAGGEELGGYIEKENNLDQNGNAWVSRNARVFGNAWVSGDAEVSGNARVFGNAWVSGDAEVSRDAEVTKSNDLIVIGPIGSRNDKITLTFSNGKVSIGCFYGTLDQLEQAATKNNRQDYLDILPGLRAILKRRLM